jgi:hypothetical protein
MRLGTVVRDGWRLFCLDFWPLVAAALLAAAIGDVSLGLLALPLQAGLCLMVLGRVRWGRRPAVGDLFAPLSPFGHWLWAWLIVMALAFAGGWLLTAPLIFGALALDGAPRDALIAVIATVCIVLGAAALTLGTIWMFCAVLMGERGFGLMSGLGESYRMVRANGFWRHLGVALVIMAVSTLLTLPLLLALHRFGGTAGFLLRLPLMGQIIVAPLAALGGAFGACLVAAAFAGDNGEGSLLPSATPGAPWPPPDRPYQYQALLQRWAAEWQAYHAARQAYEWQAWYAARPQPPYYGWPPT